MKPLAQQPLGATAVSRCCTGLLAAALTACASDTYALPERTTQVQAEEARVVALLERGKDPDFRQGGDCFVRLLGEEGDSTFAWRDCTFQDGTGPTMGISGPIRVDGDVIRTPDDGAGYSDSVRKLFPERLAEAIFSDPNRLQPQTEQP